MTLVGPCDDRIERLAGPDVEVSGFVPDLGPAYASADVVVVPLRFGGGTRIKLLEAFAHGVPVVATRAAAAGLDVTDGHHLLLADDVRDVAAAVARLATDASLAERLVAEAGPARPRPLLDGCGDTCDRDPARPGRRPSPESGRAPALRVRPRASRRSLTDERALEEIRQPGERLLGRRRGQPVGLGEDPGDRLGVPGAVAELEDDGGGRVQVVHDVGGRVVHDEAVLGLVHLETVDLPRLRVSRHSHRRSAGT